jgi:hypothetical protein
MITFRGFPQFGCGPILPAQVLKSTVLGGVLQALSVPEQKTEQNPFKGVDLLI